MVKKIFTYPNPILRKKSIDVVKFNNELHQLLDDMLETMLKNNGVGLAAIQVGIPKRVIVLDIEHKEGKKNPIFLAKLFFILFLKFTKIVPF